MSLQSLIDRPKELIEFINDCLKPKQKEKQENGEVFTPMHIIDEILDNLDIHYKAQNMDKSIFSNSQLKWFDPAVGMGNFMVAVYLRLMNGLKDEFDNKKERKRHILENMLYMSEINKKNVFVCNQLFNINNDYIFNINEGDTLVLNTLSKWGIEQFDVILGNPPYNKGGIRSHTGKQLGEKNETIWTRFIELSFKLLKPNGYLAFINPLSWLKKSHSLHNKILNKHIVWLKLWDNSQSKVEINADIPISLYILNNLHNIEFKTKIVTILKRRNLFQQSFIYLNPKQSVPLAYHNIFDKIRKYIEDNNLELDYKTKTEKSEGDKFKLPSEYSLDDMLAVDTYTIKEGIMVKKLKEPHPDMKKRKLIIANKSSFKGSFIDDRKLGLTGNDKFYVLGDKLELIQKILNFKIGKLISHFTKYRQDFLEKEAFCFIPDLRKLGIEDITEYEFYKLLNLTDDEMSSLGYTVPVETITLEGKIYTVVDNKLFIDDNLIGERHIEYNTNNELVEYIILY
jgi:hypothetical protein